MSGIMLLSVSLTLCFSWANGGTARSGAVILQDTLERVPVSLNDMFREVEELMEDTQHILEEAVDQVCVIFYSFIQVVYFSGESDRELKQLAIHLVFVTVETIRVSHITLNCFGGQLNCDDQA